MIPSGRSCPEVLKIKHQSFEADFAYATFTLFGCPFQGPSAIEASNFVLCPFTRNEMYFSYNPPPTIEKSIIDRVWALPGSLAATTGMYYHRNPFFSIRLPKE